MTANRQNGFTLPVLVAIVALLLIGVGFYYYSAREAAQVTGPVTLNTPPATSPASVENIPVEGAKQYTDESFGFSFWYPAYFKIVKRDAHAKSTSMFEKSKIMNGSGTEILGVVEIPEFVAYEVHSPSMSILSSVDAGPIGSAYNKYFFDTKTHAWMYASDGEATGGKNTTTVADVSVNTMGGLHILSGYTRFSHKVIIPLSAQNFLVVYSKCNDATDYLCDNKTGTNSTALDRFNDLVRTITATDPSVATPISAKEQKIFIQAVVDHYAGYVTPVNPPFER